MTTAHQASLSQGPPESAGEAPIQFVADNGASIRQHWEQIVESWIRSDPAIRRHIIPDSEHARFILRSFWAFSHDDIPQREVEVWLRTRLSVAVLHYWSLIGESALLGPDSPRLSDASSRAWLALLPSVIPQVEFEARNILMPKFEQFLDDVKSKVFEKLAHYPYDPSRAGHGSLKSWITKITRGVALNVLKGKDVKSNRIDSLEALAAGTNAIVSGLVVSDNLLDAIGADDAMAKWERDLTATQRQMLDLLRAGLTNEEIAQQLGSTTAAIAMRRSRLLKKAREQIYEASEMLNSRKTSNSRATTQSAPGGDLSGDRRDL